MDRTPDSSRHGLAPEALRSIDIATLPYFAGFPYLVVRLGPAVYRILLLPADWPRDAMWDAALRQGRVNGLPVCLALAADHGEYYDPETDRTQLAGAPRAGVHPPGRLVPVEGLRDWIGVDGDPTPAAPRELAARALALRDYRARRNGRGWVVVAGDPDKGGRPATPDDALRLEKPRPGGTPAGLARCAECGEWKGEFLEAAGRPRPLVLRVHCLCENRNRCAGCGALLADRKLNGNEYDEATGRVLHTGGVAALLHRCPQVITAAAVKDSPDVPALEENDDRRRRHGSGEIAAAPGAAGCQLRFRDGLADRRGEAREAPGRDFLSAPSVAFSALMFSLK